MSKGNVQGCNESYRGKATEKTFLEIQSNITDWLFKVAFERKQEETELDGEMETVGLS